MYLASGGASPQAQASPKAPLNLESIDEAVWLESSLTKFVGETSSRSSRTRVELVVN
jgi:hypothetical protein